MYLHCICYDAYFPVFLSLVTWFWLYVHHDRRKCFVFFLPIFVNNYVSTYCAIKKFFVTSCFFCAAWHLPITVDKCLLFLTISAYLPPVRRRFYSVYTIYCSRMCLIPVYILPVIRYFILSPLFLCPSYHVFALLMFVCISRFCQIFSVPVLDTPLPRPPVRRPYFCLYYSSVCLLMYIILRCKPYSQYMFLCYLVSSLSQIVSVYYNVFS